MKEGLSTDQPHEGDKYLEMLDLTDVGRQIIDTENHGQIEIRDFMEVCGEHAKEKLDQLAAMNKDDPRYESIRKGMRQVILKHYLKLPESEE